MHEYATTMLNEDRWVIYSFIPAELSGGITTLTVLIPVDVANFCAAMDTLIDQDGTPSACTVFDTPNGDLQ